MASYQYVALTRNNATSKYWVVLVGQPGESRHTVHMEALLEINRVARHRPEAAANLIVMSKSACERAYGEAWRYYMYAQEAGIR